MNNEILFLEPVFKELIWGGNSLKEKFSFNTSSEKTGEAWAVSAHKDGSSMVKNGYLAGKTLDEIWKTNPELFGKNNYDRFPLLIKFIDAKQDLSIQVHPNDNYAKINENGEYGKKECWYILDCEKDSTIIVGQKSKSKSEFCECIKNNDWDTILNEIEIKPGDFFQIDPGTIHAIKGGTLLIETQQTSDVTYRVYDYDRLQNGKPRQLHLEKALDVINFDDVPVKKYNFHNSKEKVNELISCDKYTVNLLNAKNKLELIQDKNFMIFSVIEGNGKIDNYKINAGESFILPYKYGKFILEGNMKIISSYV